MKRNKDHHQDVDEFERKARKSKKGRRYQEAEEAYDKYSGKIDPAGFLTEEEELWDDFERNDRR